MLPRSTRPHIPFCRDAELARVIRAEPKVFLHSLAHLAHVVEVAVALLLTVLTQQFAVHVNGKAAAAAAKEHDLLAHAFTSRVLDRFIPRGFSALSSVFSDTIALSQRVLSYAHARGIRRISRSMTTRYPAVTSAFCHHLSVFIHSRRSLFVVS